MKIEQSVRPFQTPDVSPPRLSPSSGGVTTGPLQVIVGGSPTVGADITISVSHPLLPGGQVTVSYVLVNGDNLQNAAVGAVNAVNANASLLNIGVTATGVSGQPFEFEIDQPATLDPQATIAVSSTPGIMLSLSNGSVSLVVEKSAQVQTETGSMNASSTQYTHHYPKEVTLASLNIIDLSIPELPRIRFP